MLTAVVTILIFLVMVSLHEFGHFITGRLLGFKILEYAIGFGPAIWKSKNTEIKYSVRLIPLGGYCQFEGEDGESDDKGAFSKQAVWKRIIVVAAGGICNIILGFVLFLAIIPSSGEVVTNYVNTVDAYSYANEAGLMSGDKIIEINGKNVHSYNDIRLYTQDFTEDTECEAVIKRNGEKITLKFKPSRNTVIYSYGENGITVSDMTNGNHKTEKVYRYSDGIKKNDELVGKSETVERLIIGFTPVSEKPTVFNVIADACNQTRFVVKLVYNSLWQMITGKVGMDSVSGPVGVVSEINTAVNSGSYSWLYVLNLTALLTINLGVFNLLPIPALDGGRLFFMLVEIITRKKIPPEKEGMVHAIGFILLMAFVAVISFNDIMRLLGK